MSRVSTHWRPPLTRGEEDDLFMLTLENDTKDAPWMTMGDLQFWSASTFAHSLRNYAHEQGLPWYVASMHPIKYTWAHSKRRHQLAPDVYVAFRPEHPRSSYRVAVEGSFPPFVLEVVSPESATRDQITKRTAYELLGAQEYALFTPLEDAPSTLEGYRRSKTGVFEAWPLDAEGGLWSDVLGLRLVVRGMLLRAQTLAGRLLPTLEEALGARREAELNRIKESDARRQAEEAQRRAEDESERLRQELERYRNPGR